MATLVLTAAGSIFGPIGGAVGALIGQAIDGRILQPKGRQGPRLQDLRIQSSSYGTPIPKLFGTMRVAGTVIWSTDLVEHRARSGGGKGRPSTTNYGYSASFAVALSARSIRGVGRIWADGNLIRGSAGDWKQQTGFRLHLGGEDQQPDPFIASAEGADGTPAYRGCAYAVFENMALEPYGNRIPSLTFEVEADPGSISVGAMLSDLSEGTIIGDGGGALGGFAASGDSVSAIIDGLGEVYPFVFREADTGLELASVEQPPVEIRQTEIVEGGSRRGPALSELPATLTISYYDRARDCQIGQQSERRSLGRGTHRVELPAVLDATEARLLAERAIDRRRREGVRCSVQTGWKRLDLIAGAIVLLGEDPTLWRVERRSIVRDGVRLELRSFRAASGATGAADSGRSVAAPDHIHGPTELTLLDLPGYGDEVQTTPNLHVAAWGSMSGWRRASLLMSLDQGGSWQPVGNTAPAATAGLTEQALASGSATTTDRQNTIVVQLAHDEMELQDAEPSQLLAGANLALIGDELLQFGTATPLGGGRWRLGELLRGRGGTEWALSDHLAGDRFTLIDEAALAGLPIPLTMLDAEVRVMATGIGDPVPQQKEIAFRGEGLRPPAPVHLKARAREDGGFDISWIRRSRAGWAWGEGDTTMGEADERYRIMVRRADGTERASEQASPHFVYEPTLIAEDAVIGGYVDVYVAQIGTFRTSRWATLRVHM